ncbi:OmpA family protein [Prevotella copri]|uniref:OmpA family protein n=1 Tax=Segatella copri TaxID=165179 RepID=A0AAP3BEV2_9BACT|nr:OmpA family protein [Segatella copri]MCW4128434.1 OmpA family protein [Segatella copri]MCW4415945.1 OmpA family protein [Segatella copri]MCW4421197.1 OmpA family protein [Segatella copri]
MKLNKVLLSGVIALSCVSASAQEADKTVNVFTPHWYAQAQVGGQYTLGEIGFGKLLSPNVQVGIGYNFNQVVGARFSLNTWQSKAGQNVAGNVYKWKWNYVAPMVDATFNLTNLFCEYNPDRVVEFGVFGGIGANIAWGNDEAADAQKAILAGAGKNLAEVQAPLENLWDGTKTRFVARVGANVDFRVSDRVKLGVELSANTLSDKYNSKKAGNPDWYFNALVGVKVALGETHTTKVIPAPKPVEKIIERIIEKPAPAPAPKVETKVVEENFRRDIFFPIGNTNIAKSQRTKIAEIVEYMKENPDAKITLTGYADKGTGSVKFNDKIAARRALTVYNTLAAKGVAKSRMIKQSKGCRVQPFEENDMNRVAICIAK